MINLINTGTIELFVTSFLILFSYHLLLSVKNINSLSEKILSAILMGSAQIILSIIILGLAGVLKPVCLIVFNITTSVLVISFCYYRESRITGHIRNDLAKLRNILRVISEPYILYLLILIALVSLWLYIASILLPPRGIDDLTYHLPVIYNYIIKGKLSLLPVEYRFHVAFPMNAELLFLWPTIFTGNLHYIGLVQLFIAFYGVLSTYSIGRFLSVSVRNSFLAGLLFLLTPVVLIQSGVAYIDIIVSVFFVTGLYFSVKYFTAGRKQYLYLAGISAGLILGMKYTMILTVLILQIMMILGFRKNRTKLSDIAVYYLLITLLAGFWYLRNLIQLGNPIYPFSIIPGSDNFLRTDSFNIIFLIKKSLNIVKTLFRYDAGIGSLHGGFGLVFWGITIPCWIYCLTRSFFSNCKNKTAHIFIWSQFLVGFIYFILAPSDIFFRFPRHAIFIIPVGMLSLAMILDKFKNHKIYRNSVLVLCCFFSSLSLFQVARAKTPSYSVEIPIYDIMHRKAYSDFRYLRMASTSMAFLYETLDYITLDKSGGLDVYFANSVLDYAAPVYGSKLQNRVWNFRKDRSKMPDALLLLINDPENTKFYGKKITPEELSKSGKYQIIDIAEGAYLYLDRNILLNDRSIRNSLLKQYRNYYEPEIRFASASANLLDDKIPVVTSSLYGIGFLYQELNGRLDNPVYIVPDNYEYRYSKYRNIEIFYSIGKKIDGFHHIRMPAKNIGGTDNVIYLNYKGKTSIDNK